jgi:hypothetical protein
MAPLFFYFLLCSARFTTALPAYPVIERLALKEP